TAAAPQANRVDWAGLGAVLIEVADENGHADLSQTLHALAAKGLTRILCEGGGQLAAALIRAGLVDEVILHSAGAMIGSEGRPALGALSLVELAQAPRLTLQSQRRLGNDVETRWSL
ncbi:MAG: dihydrofolate reductase family protein, partial [Paracoccaceae bacterium]